MHCKFDVTLIWAKILIKRWIFIKKSNSISKYNLNLNLFNSKFKCEFKYEYLCLFLVSVNRLVYFLIKINVRKKCLLLSPYPRVQILFFSRIFLELFWNEILTEISSMNINVILLINNIHFRPFQFNLNR